MPSRLVVVLAALCFVGAAANGPATYIGLSAETGAACLDGSPYGLYFRKSTTGSTQWTMFLEGGGWCYNEKFCLDRANTTLGSSKHWGKNMNCGCMNVRDTSGFAQDCNCIFLAYCDGASFSGYTEKPVQVDSGKIIFRGMRNLDASVAHALDHLGMDKSTQVVLTGSSAGGLATFLHADRVARQVKGSAPKCKTVRAVPQVGYFLDHDNVKHSKSNYTAWMKYVYHMQNLTSESNGGTLSDECMAHNRENPHYCFMSPHMHQFIKTPYFVLNSKYDAWQLSNELQVKLSEPSARSAVLQYGKDFMKQFAPVMKEKQNGAFITSCICHGCPFGKVPVGNKRYDQYYAEWFLGVSSQHYVIDPRGPNGNGTIHISQCMQLPGKEAMMQQYK